MLHAFGCMVAIQGGYRMARGWHYAKLSLSSALRLSFSGCVFYYSLKKNQKAPRPSEHPPVRGEKMTKRLGGIKGCKYKTSSWHLNGFPDGNNIGSTV